MREIADTLHTILPKPSAPNPSEHAWSLIHVLGVASDQHGVRRTATTTANLATAVQGIAAYIAQLETRIVEGGR